MPLQTCEGQKKKNPTHKRFKPGTVNTSTKVTLHNTWEMFLKGHNILQNNKGLQQETKTQVHLLMATHLKYRQRDMTKCPRQLPKSHSKRAFMVCNASPGPSPTPQHPNEPLPESQCQISRDHFRGALLTACCI